MQNMRVIRRLHPYLPEWLISRHHQGEHISRDDVIRIVQYDRSAAADPIVCEYLLRALRGELTARRGRKRTPSGELRLIFAETLSYELARRYEARDRWWKNRGITRPRGDLSPTDRAHAVVARILGYSSLEVVRNSLSSRKKRLNSCA